MTKRVTNIAAAGPSTTEEVEREYVITPPLVKESAPIRVIDIIRTDADGNRFVTEVHLLGELLTD